MATTITSSGGDPIAYTVTHDNGSTGTVSLKPDAPTGIIDLAFSGPDGPIRNKAVEVMVTGEGNLHLVVRAGGPVTVEVLEV